jgi:hypothetical protein
MAGTRATSVDVFFVAPDKQRILHFEFEKSLDIWSARTVPVKAGVINVDKDRTTVESMCQMHYNVKPDLILNSKWHVISVTDPVQTCILLQKV